MKIVRNICIVVFAVLAAAFGLISLLAAGLLLADLGAEKSARVVPSYEKVDLAPLLEKETWTEEDYALIYRQTGLTKLGADSVAREELPAFQEAFFFEGKVAHDGVAETTWHDILLDENGDEVEAPLAPLENGDVLITSTCHTYGWRNGHAALVVNEQTKSTLESYSLGIPSDSNGTAEWFQGAANFILLRLKGVSKEDRAALAADAYDRLDNIPYDLFVGFFSKKDQFAEGVDNAERGTHCSHLVWQAFKNAGYDIDSNGGPLVTPRDICRSPLFEVVQVYGFDADKLW